MIKQAGAAAAAAALVGAAKRTMLLPRSCAALRRATLCCAVLRYAVPCSSVLCLSLLCTVIRLRYAVRLAVLQCAVAVLQCASVPPRQRTGLQVTVSRCDELGDGDDGVRLGADGDPFTPWPQARLSTCCASRSRKAIQQLRRNA